MHAIRYLPLSMKLLPAITVLAATVSRRSGGRDVAYTGYLPVM